MDEEQPKTGEQHNPDDAARAAPHETPHAKKAQENMVMAILAYIGPLILVSYLLAKDDPFVKFHIKQGLVLVIGEIASWMIVSVFWLLFPVVQILNIFLFVLSVVGIIRATKGEMKALPFVGHYAEKFKF